MKLSLIYITYYRIGYERIWDYRKKWAQYMIYAGSYKAESINKKWLVVQRVEEKFVFLF